MPIQFHIEREDSRTAARAGRLVTPHGEVETPAFMPVGTQGSVKTLSPWELASSGARMVLGNTYHLFQRPGAEVIRDAGGLAAFTGWDGATLTDSGGYQVFSLAKRAKVRPEGVTFHSHLDGSLHFFSPERVIEINFDLRPDVMMVLDECTAWPVSHEEARRSMELTCDWAARAWTRYQAMLREVPDDERALAPVPFAIVQGGTYADLRQVCAERLRETDWPGFGIGGLGVGEPTSARQEMTDVAVAALPRDRPRYLMGVGFPEDLFDAVGRGVDLFDCVLPTRNGRTGWMFTSRGRRVIKNATYARDLRSPDEACDCLTCRGVSRAYLRHLFSAGEMLGPRLASLHNMRFYQGLMAGMRDAIRRDAFEEYRRDFFARYAGSREEAPD